MTGKTESNRLEKVRSLIATVLNLQCSEISDDLKMYGHPQWDSLAQVDIILKLEEAFDLAVDDAMARNFTTVAKIAKHIGTAR